MYSERGLPAIGPRTFAARMLRRSDTKLARIVAIKKFIRKNYRNQALDVDETVAYSFLSRRALYYLFEEEEFQVNGYIRALRTVEALELLTTPNSWKRSLTVTAEASGFTSLQAMRRADRESTGFSLREVQENPEVVRIQAAELIKLNGHERVGTEVFLPSCFAWSFVLYRGTGSASSAHNGG